MIVLFLPAMLAKSFVVPHELPLIVVSPAQFIVNNQSAESFYPRSDTGKVGSSYGGLDHVQDLTLVTVWWQTVQYVALLHEETKL